MKEIKLTQGFATLVDDEDFEYLNQWKWHVRRNKNVFYAARDTIRDKLGNHPKIHMHRLIMNTPDGMMVDHIDHNGLNNQKSNLRICTHGQNMCNTSSRGRSKYLGVSYLILNRGNNSYEYIRASIQLNGELFHLGLFTTEEDAAMAYDKKAKELFGEFANLNFKQL